MRWYPYALVLSFAPACVNADDSTIFSPNELEVGMECSECPEGTLCLDPMQIQDGEMPKRARVAVIWQQIAQTELEPLGQVAYDAPFGKGERLEVPLYSLDPPERDALLFCERACADPNACPCVGDERVAFGQLVVTADTNDNGRMDVEELRASTIGRGHFVIGRSDTEIEKVPPSFGGTVLGNYIPKGIHAYELVASTDRVFVTPATRSEGQRVYLCPEGSSETCTLPFPQIGRPAR